MGSEVKDCPPRRQQPTLSSLDRKCNSPSALVRVRFGCDTAECGDILAQICPLSVASGLAG